MKIIDTIGGNL